MRGSSPTTHTHHRISRAFILLCVCVVAACWALPAQAQIEPQVDDEQAVFKVYVERKLWGTVTVLCDPAGYFIHLPELLNLLEYTYVLEPENRFMRGAVAADSLEYTIRGDTLWQNQVGAPTTAIRWTPQGELFVEGSFLEVAYGIHSLVSYNSLSVALTPSLMPPVALRQQREARRAKLLRAQEALNAIPIDTLPLHLLKVNALGYTLSPYFSSTGESTWPVRAAVNGELFKGAMLVQYNHSPTSQGSNRNAVFFNWQRPYLNDKWLKTVNLYRDYSNLQSQVSGLVTGLLISNERNNSALDRSFTYQGKTLPNAEVEIYNNGVLIQYVRSDEQGNYEVQVAVQGGNNNLRAVTYDAYGAPISSEKLLYLPPNLQPKGRLGYRFMAGALDEGGAFLAPKLAYGLTSYLTLSATNETILQTNRRSSIVLLDADLALSHRWQWSINYTPAVKWGSSLSTFLGRGLNGTLRYIHYNPNQRVMRYAPIDEISLMMNGSLPFRKLQGNFFASTNYYKYAYGESLDSYVGVSLWWRKLISTFTASVNNTQMKISNPTYALRMGYAFNQRWYDEVSIDYRPSRREITVRNRLNYQTQNRLNCFMELSYNGRNGQYLATVGVNWRTSWTQLRTGISHTNRSTSGYMSLGGSMLIHDRGVALSDRFVGGSSLLIVPYVDRDGDLEYDAGEPIQRNARITLRSSAERRNTSRGILYANIQDNRPIYLVVPQQGFEDISWQITPQEIHILLSKYQSQTIYLPIRVLSEVSGTVFLMAGNTRTEASNLPLLLTNTLTGKSIVTHTDDWGYYNCPLLTCGDYTLEVHPEQLNKKHLRDAACTQHTFSIPASLEGIQVDEINIELVPKKATETKTSTASVSATTTGGVSK